MRRMLLLVRPAWGRLVGAVGLAALSLACGVALLAVSAWLITRAAFMPPVLTLMVAIVGVRTFGIGRAVFRYLERLVAHDAALRALVDIRVRLYRPLEQLAPAVYWRSGDLLQRLSSDVDAIADVLIRGWVPVLSAGLVLVASVGLLLLLLPAAAVITGLALLLAVLAALLAAVRRARLSTGLADQRAERVAVVTEAVQAAADPAVLVAGGWRDRLTAVDAAEYRHAGRIGSWDGLAAAAAVLATGAATLGCWLAGRDAGMNAETLTVVTLLPLALLDVVAILPAAFDHLQRADRLSGRLGELLDAGIAEQAAPVAPDGPITVTVRDLAVTWPGRHAAALAAVDLDLAPGGRIAVVGPSGSGKSTLLDALLGFAPFTGEVLVNGDPDPNANRRAAMSLCDQEAYLFDSTIAENVRLARAAATDDEVADALRRARLGSWIDALPDGMHTRVGHLGAMVSGGQRQRIAYARALLADRQILLLDEPTAGLDEDTGAALVADLLDAGPDVCVVLVTHETALLGGFDEVLELGGVGRHPPAMSVDALIGAVRTALAGAADPARAPAMQAYMKSAMPYYGVALPELRRACRPVFADHPLGTAAEFDDAVRRLFTEARHREERYAAVAFARERRYRMYQTPARVPLYADLVVAGAWWDTVDELASNLIGPILLAHRSEVRPMVREWISSPDLWLRRTSIIVQLTFRDDTDLDLLTEAVDANAGDTDFFIRKAIGWALRQYARTDPDWVRGFVDGRERTLSGLSKREARKHLIASE